MFFWFSCILAYLSIMFPFNLSIWKFSAVYLEDDPKESPQLGCQGNRRDHPRTKQGRYSSNVGPGKGQSSTACICHWPVPTDLRDVKWHWKLHTRIFPFNDKIISICIGSLIPKPFANEAKEKMQSCADTQQKRDKENLRYAYPPYTPILELSLEACFFWCSTKASLLCIPGRGWQHERAVRAPAPAPCWALFNRTARWEQRAARWWASSQGTCRQERHFGFSWIAWLMIVACWRNKKASVCAF